MVRFARCGSEGTVKEFRGDVLTLACYEMVVIDSGNSHGDSWIATFYPKQMSMPFVDEHFNPQIDVASTELIG